MGPTGDKFATWACRALIVVAGACLVLRPSLANSLVQSTWDYMRRSKVVAHDTFEPGLVVITFFASIWFFKVLDNWMLNSNTAIGRALHRWRVDPSDDGNMQPWAFQGFARLKQETFWYIAPLAVFDFVYPRRALPVAAPSALLLLTQVVAGLLLYDALFFVGHLACHRLPWLYRRAHAKHHRYKHVRACETIVLSGWELALDVACSIAALNILHAHPMSRAVYNATIVYLLTELHSGYSMPWSLERVVPWGLWAGPTLHAAHHKDGRAHYQKFATWLDRLCGTDGRHCHALKQH